MLLAVAAAVLLLATGCSTGSDAVDQQAGGQQGYVPGDGTVTQYPPSKRRAAPAVAGTTLDGRKLSVSSYPGKVVVINFWGQWCAPCRAEAQGLQQAYAATSDRGVRFLGVDVRDDKSQARAFTRSYHITYPSLYDPDGAVAVRFRATPIVTTPQTIVLDRQHRIAAVFRKAVLRSDLQPLLDELASSKDGR